MIKMLATLKGRAAKFYDLIKELDQMPMRMIQGEFYEEKQKVEVRAPRKNNVSVEDLRPKK